MMAGRSVGLLELDGDVLSAMLVRVSGAGAAVRSAAIVPRPTSIDPSEAEGLAPWLKQAAEEADFGRTPVLLALPRRDVLLKRLITPGASAVDLPGIVRLQMAKQLAVPGSGAAIDFLPEDGRDEQQTVLAGALPTARVDVLREGVRRAGLRLSGVTLRCFAAVPLSAMAEGLELVVQMGPGSAEFVLIERGCVLFARTVEWRRPEEGQDYAEAAARLAVDAKRMWMSYRLSHANAQLERLLVVGDDACARASAKACGEALDAPSSTAMLDPSVEWDAGIPRSTQAALAALPRLAAVDHRLDFANPRQAPDVHARRRQMALLAVLLLIVVGGGGGFLSMQRLNSLREDVAATEKRVNDLALEYQKMLMLKARYEHLRGWREAKPDWLSHLRLLSEHLPAPSETILSTFRGRMDPEPVQFTASDQGDPISGAWRVPTAVSIVIEGQGRSVEWVADVRRRLLELGTYTVSSTSPDAGPGIDLKLTASSWAPPVKTEGGQP